MVREEPSEFPKGRTSMMSPGFAGRHRSGVGGRSERGLDDHHRAGRLPQDLFRHAARQEPSQPRLAVRAHHDHVAMERLDQAEDLLGGVALGQSMLDANTRVRRLGPGQLRRQSLRLDGPRRVRQRLGRHRGDGRHHDMEHEESGPVVAARAQAVSNAGREFPRNRSDAGSSGWRAWSGPPHCGWLLALSCDDPGKLSLPGSWMWN